MTNSTYLSYLPSMFGIYCGNCFVAERNWIQQESLVHSSLVSPADLNCAHHTHAMNEVVICFSRLWNFWGLRIWKTLIKHGIFVASSEKMSPVFFFYAISFTSTVCNQHQPDSIQLRKSCKNEVVPLGMNVMLRFYWVKNNPPLVNILLL